MKKIKSNLKNQIKLKPKQIEIKLKPNQIEIKLKPNQIETKTN